MSATAHKGAVHRGLPKSYRLDVSEHDLDDRPADLDDYLGGPREAALAAGPSVLVPREKETADRTPRRRSHHQANNPSTDIPPALPRSVAVADGLLTSKPRGGRIQVNMSRATKDKLQELLDVIGQYSHEPHPTAAELIQTLIAILHDSRGNLNLSSVPARGGWGSKSAEIFQASLKQELMRAIGRHQTHRGEMD